MEGQQILSYRIINSVTQIHFVVGSDYNVTLSEKSSIILGENKADFCRKGHKLVADMHVIIFQLIFENSTLKNW